MQSRDAEFLATRRDVLRRQHGSVGRGLITVSLHFHPARHARDGFAAAGITQVSL